MAKTMPARLLVVDQDARYGEWLKHHLGVLCPESPVTVLQLSDFERWSRELSGRDCDVLMLAACFGNSPEDPRAQGLDLLRQLREKPHFPAVIAVAEEGNELTAVRAMQLGAVDYLPKRLLTPERLKTSVKLALRMIEKRVARRLASLQQSMDGESRSEVLPISMAVVSTDAAEAADAKAAEALLRKSTGVPADSHESSGDISRNIGMQRFAEAAPGGSGEPYPAASAKSGDATVAPATTVAASTHPAPATGSTQPARAVAAAATGAATVGAATVDPASSVSAPTAVHPPEADARSADISKGGPANETAAPGIDSAKADSARSNSAKGESPKPASAKVETARPRETNTAPAVPPARAPGGEFMPANFIPGYTIHATIGESEKAAVYVATSAARKENVALKVSKTIRDEVAGRQFLEREYTAIVAIRDPSVVQIHDYGVHAGYEYLVMEYLPRGDLKARMQQPLTEQEALRYVAQIAAALQVVHHAGLLHRDLKPPNVMLRENDDVALIDFGLARALDGSTPSTRTGVLRGSPYYMSPEQAMGELLDARSDFYSLGIIFYEMLTGKKPYTGGSAMDVLQQHVNAPLPMLPKALAHHEPLLLKMLAKSREDRFGSAEEILVAISARRAADRAARESEQVESTAA
jgi:DNA-binding NarL/FixJ family response regulator